MAGKNRKDEFTQAELSVAAQATFSNIMELWQIDETDAMRLLGFDQLTEEVYVEWKREPKIVELSKEKFERLSYVFGIYKALQELLTDEEAADAWVKKSNNANFFNGHSALKRMLAGNVSDLYEVHKYLNSELGYMG